MTDILEIFGTEYTGVTGIKATDDQSGTKVYIRPQGTKSISANGTGIDVAEYALVNVSVAGAEYTRTVIVPQQTVTPNSSRVASLNAIGAINDAENYIVTLDGIEWFTTSETLWSANYVIGDANWFLGTPSNYIYPFGVGREGSTTEAAFSNTNQHIIKIERLDFVTGGTTLTTKNITANGTYNASSDSADGYSQVAVNVPSDAFIVTLSWDSVEELWMPDKTITALQDAYDNDEKIIFVRDDGYPAGWFYDDDYVFVYFVFSGGNNELIQTYYSFTTQGVEEVTADRTIVPVFESPSVTYTPTESQQTDTVTYNRNYYNGMEEVSVTVNAISSTYVGTGITRRSSTDLTASGATVTVPSGYYSAQASKAVASGTAGTPTATKGAVSNHSISVTPSVTNTAGYISGGTNTGTAVTVSASELVSGSQTITQNGTVDVTNLAEVVVSVEGGGGSGMTVATATATPSSASASISFTGLSGEPTSFAVISSADLATGASPYKTAAVVFDGSDLHGQTITNTSNAQVSYDGTHFSKTYSNGTLTITGSTYWQANEYTLVYTYGGTSINIDTADVQVGSGATSITFTGLTDEPDYFSCIFKSNFATSSGYQRVIAVVYDGNSTYGLAMDSGAKAESSWSYTYSNGSLTISSQSTNNGGYFHQPGYYQLTYGIGGTVEPTEIEVEPLSVTQNGTYTAPTGKAYSPVTVNVSGGSVNIDTKSMTNSSNQNTSISFSSMKGQPKAFFARCTATLSRSSSNTYYYVADMVYDGTSTVGNMHARSNGQYSNITSGYSWSYSGTTLTLSSSGARNTSPGSFYNGTYELVYVY